MVLFGTTAVATVAPRFGRLETNEQELAATRDDLKKSWNSFTEQVKTWQQEAEMEVNTEHLDSITFAENQLNPQLTSIHRRYWLFDSLIRHTMRVFDLITLKREHSGTVTPTKDTPVIAVETLRHFNSAQATRYATSLNQKMANYEADLLALIQQAQASPTQAGVNNESTSVFKTLLAKGHLTIGYLRQSIVDKLQACFGSEKPLPLIGQTLLVLPSSTDAKVTHTISINYFSNDDDGGDKQITPPDDGGSHGMTKSSHGIVNSNSLFANKLISKYHFKA